MRAELSTHIISDRPPATHTQFLEYSFRENKSRVRQKKATGFSPAPGAQRCTPCRPQQASPQRSRAQSPDKGVQQSQS